MNRPATSEDPLILTALFDTETQARFEELRRRYFPPERNFIPAHLTLFHHLPGDERAHISATLRDECGSLPPPDFQTVGPLDLGRGAAVKIECPALDALRKRLAGHWSAWLTRQDQQGFRPHVTVQNKVDRATALSTLRLLATHELPPSAGRVEGLRMWAYLGGPWELLDEFPFGG